MTKPLGVALIGTGFMGKCHALAYRNARAIMGDVPTVTLETLCDVPAEKASDLASEFGFTRATDDWRTLLDDPRIDVLSITTPNRFHREMAVTAIEAGKHVWCEKPMALTLEDAEAMTRAAKASDVVTMVGYNYLRNPAYIHAQMLLQQGAIGRPVHFRGWVDEDYQADPDLPWTWRATHAEAGLGTLGDLMCHLVSLADGLMGPIESLIADMQTIHTTRPLPDGSGRADVENEDTASALVRFASGVQGALHSSRSAWGRKSTLAWEVHGTNGTLAFDQERMNELQLYQNDGPKAQQGFKTILTSPEHPPYGRFCPAPGHQLGFNDQKVIEAAEFLRAIRDGRPADVGFAKAIEFERVIHAIARSASQEIRVSL